MLPTSLTDKVSVVTAQRSPTTVDDDTLQFPSCGTVPQKETRSVVAHTLTTRVGLREIRDPNTST